MFIFFYGKGVPCVPLDDQKFVAYFIFVFELVFNAGVISKTSFLRVGSDVLAESSGVAF